MSDFKNLNNFSCLYVSGSQPQILITIFWGDSKRCFLGSDPSGFFESASLWKKSGLVIYRIFPVDSTVKALFFPFNNAILVFEFCSLFHSKTCLISFFKVLYFLCQLTLLD